MSKISQHLFTDATLTKLLVNRKAQLSLEKIYYSLYGNDLEGHPRSMIFVSSERAYVISY